MPTFQLLASWQLTQRGKSFPGHANTTEDHSKRGLLGKWSALKICRACSNTYTSVIQQTVQQGDLVCQVYRGHTHNLAIAPANSIHSSAASLEEGGTSLISQGKPNSVTVLNDINSMWVFEASIWTVLYATYRLESHNRARLHFDLLIASSYTAFQTEYQSLDREHWVWFLVS